MKKKTELSDCIRLFNDLEKEKDKREKVQKENKELLDQK